MADMDPALMQVIAQAVTYVVFGVMGTVLYIFHRKGEQNATNISDVAADLAGLGGRVIGREEHAACRQQQAEALEAQRQENRTDHQRMFDKLEKIRETTAALEGEVKRINGGAKHPDKP